MPRAQIRSKLLDLIDSDDSDDGLATLGLSVKTTGAVRSVQRAGTTANKSATAMPAAKKGRAAAPAPANRVTKPAAGAARGRRTSDRLAAALEKAEEQQTTRAALADESNDAPERAAKANGAAMGRRAKKGAGRGAENEEKASPPTLATPPASDNSAARTKGRARGRPKKVAEREIPDSTHRLRVAPPAARTAKGRRVGRKAAESEPIVEEETEIPETQQPVPDATDVEMDHLLEDTEQQMDDVPDTPNADAASFPLGSAMRKTAPAIPGSALQPVAQGPSSFEGGGGDVGLRRRLGELSKKYESLELKYRDLRDIAVKEAERNFDRLKKQGEEKTKTANQLIASLKAELATQKELGRDATRLRKQLDERDAKVDALQAQVTQLTMQLAEGKTEAKALTMKLAAARTAEAAAAGKAAAGFMPGSAIKNSAMSRGGAAGAVQQATQVAQWKEELYGDLTGLIVRDVKEDAAGEKVYDCIQTGRNGTLHFKLSVGTDPSSENYDEAQFMYMPQLKPDRDAALLEVLPDYLVEEITFPRPHANKFYARVMKSLTER